MRKIVTVAAALALSACQITTVPTNTTASKPAPKPAATKTTTTPTLAPRTAAANFVAVAERVEPVAEAMCRSRTRGVNCDYRILVDDRPGQPSNAYQTLDANKRPLIVFTVPLIAQTRNQDELAFVMGHEAAHHIAGHIPKAQDTAMAGALVAGVLASLSGAGAQGVEAAQNIGANVAARSYSKGFELEADSLGAIIAHSAGYDPLNGAEYFNRIPDPGNKFLGSHPPNSSRIAAVRKTVAGLN